MLDHIIDFQCERVATASLSEWQHQILHAESSLKLLEEHFLWTLEQLKGKAASGPDTDDAIFFETEVPNALKEAREALSILKMLSRQEG